MNKPWHLAALGALLASCAASPSDSTPGMCRLDCSKPRVTGVEFIVEPLIPDSVKLAYECVGNPGDVISFSGPLTVVYRIYQKAPSANKSSTTTPTAPAEGLTAVDGETIIPLGGIGFQPLIYGAMDGSKTNSEFKIKNPDGSDGVSPYEFNGVVTSASEFCSDSCGVMKFSIWPVCIVPATNTVHAGIIVDGIKANDFFTVPITGKKPE